MYWKCPRCKSKVNFKEQMEYVFSDYDEADFDPKNGLYFHTIFCDGDTCDASWVVSIGGMESDL